MNREQLMKMNKKEMKAHGKDYYIYLCDNGKDSSNEVYLISENSTFPCR